MSRNASFNAAVSRLDDLIAHAEKLAEEGKIIEKEGWLDVQEVPRPKGKVVAVKENGNEKRLGGDIAHSIHNLFTPSIFARDGISKIFD